MLLAVLIFGGSCFAISTTLPIAALPELARAVDAGPAGASWILTSFLISASVCTPIVGKLGDVYGRRRVLVWALVLLAAGGAVATVAAAAGSLAGVIAGRVVQGVGSGVFPLAFGIVRESVAPARVPGMLAVISATLGVGAGLGLPLSGLIVDNADPAWLFCVALAALPAAVAAWVVVRTAPAFGRPQVDWLGAALLAAALTCVLMAVTQSNGWGLGSARTLGFLGAGLALAAIWVAVEARVSEPLIDLRVLAERPVLMTNLSSVLTGYAMMTSFVLIPQFAQAGEGTGYGFGHTVTQSGLLLLPAALTQVVAGPAAGALGARVGYRLTLALGALLFGGPFAFLVVEHTHPWQLVLAGALMGVGTSLGFAAMTNLIVGAVPHTQVGVATGINTIMRTIGGAFGVAVCTAVLTADTLPGTALGSEGAYVTAFAISAAAGMLAIPPALLVSRSDRRPGARPRVLART